MFQAIAIFILTDAFIYAYIITYLTTLTDRWWWFPRCENFYPETWGDDPIWRAYCSNGWLNKPLNRLPLHQCRPHCLGCLWRWDGELGTWFISMVKNCPPPRGDQNCLTGPTPSYAHDSIQEMERIRWAVPGTPFVPSLDPCMVCLPAFPTKINQMQVHHTLILWDICLKKPNVQWHSFNHSKNDCRLIGWCVSTQLSTKNRFSNQFQPRNDCFFRGRWWKVLHLPTSKKDPGWTIKPQVDPTPLTKKTT